MNEILLCSHDPILVRQLYGLLRDEGYHVAVADHPSIAVQMCLNRPFDSVIFDAEPFGLSAEDAIQIIRRISPDMPVIMTGNQTEMLDALNIKAPVDLEEFQKVIHSIHQYKNHSHFKEGCHGNDAERKYS